VTKLLVSVRNAVEAQAALEGGADVIDVKEPAHGALGAAHPRVWGEVLEVVAGRVPVSAALGEAWHLGVLQRVDLSSGLAMIKVGLSMLRTESDVSYVLKFLSDMAPMGTQLVAVTYADNFAADAPHPDLVIRVAATLRLPVLLVDTFDKTKGDLWSALEDRELAEIVAQARANGMRLALAGSLTEGTIPRALELAPDWIAVRGAACEGEDRAATVSAARVARLAKIVRRDAVNA
jgi:uncharacterized protein (UPF0264 family)